MEMENVYLPIVLVVLLISYKWMTGISPEQRKQKMTALAEKYDDM